MFVSFDLNSELRERTLGLLRCTVTELRGADNNPTSEKTEVQKLGAQRRRRGGIEEI